MLSFFVAQVRGAEKAFSRLHCHVRIRIFGNNRREICKTKDLLAIIIDALSRCRREKPK